MRFIQQKERRQTNIELLRIICMFCILIGHYVGKGGIVTSEQSIYQKISLFFWGGGKLGVNIFALIIGYFGAYSTKNQGRKILNLWFQILFYAIISFLMYCIFRPEDISMYIIKRTVFPMSTGVYWFVTSTFGIYFVQTYINRMLEELDKAHFSCLVIILLIMYCIIPTIIYNENPFLSNFGWLLVLYIIGYYISKFPIAVNKKICLLVFTGMWIFMWTMDIVLQTYTNVEVNYLSYMYRIPMFLASVTLFLCFVNTQMKYNVVINKISKNVLGVYLLHDCLFFRNYYWNYIGAYKYYDSFLFLWHMVFTSVLLFVAGIIVDKIRDKLTGIMIYKRKWYTKLTDKINFYLVMDKN